MKYVITWNERPQGSPIEYENAQKRAAVLAAFSRPGSLYAEYARVSWMPVPPARSGSGRRDGIAARLGQRAA